eukprot:635072-Prymnesium_polylepis.1
MTPHATVVALCLLATQLHLARACSNILVTPGASKDGSALVGDNDDSSKRHGLVTRFAAADHAAGDVREIWDFEAGTLNGVIAQPKHTFNTVSHANEKGVVIAETTHGGIANLSRGNGTILDYGSLIVTTLQRASTAREAISTIVQLANTYGYASSMEGFSISDGSEGRARMLAQVTCVNAGVGGVRMLASATRLRGMRVHTGTWSSSARETLARVCCGWRFACRTATSRRTPTRHASPRSCRATTPTGASRRPTSSRSPSSTSCGAARPPTAPSPSRTCTIRSRRPALASARRASGSSSRRSPIRRTLTRISTSPTRRAST